MTTQRLRPIAAATLLIAAGGSPAATIIVNSAADAVANDGACTLREAITAANSNAASGAAAGECAAGQPGPTVDLIHFAIAGGGLHTITPGSTLPDVTEIVTIDGYTQAGSSENTLAVGDDAVLQVEVSGANLPFPFGQMFRIAANGATVRGLVLSHSVYSAVGVGFPTLASGVVIEGNFIGVDAAGGTVTAGTNFTPVQIQGSANRLGGTTPAARNVIGGGGNAIVWIGGTGNLVQGNYIGVSADGTQGLRPADGANATTAIELGPLGVATGTEIGGSAPGAGNVLFGTNLGINLGGGVHDTKIKGNYIGVDATGTRALGENVGISTNNAPTGTIVGGALAGEGNVISGNNVGIQLLDGASGTIVQGNRIGTDASGTKPVPNKGQGIFVQTTSAGSTIGGPNPGQGNTIAYNCGAGIDFWPFGYVNWPLLRNSIHSNRGLGITLLHGSTPTQNDAGDLDSGTPNEAQNYPVITAASVNAGSVDIAGTLDSAANRSYRLEFFSGIGCHPSGNGEGRHYLGAIDVLTDGGGSAGFGAGSAQFAVPSGHTVFTATATDPDGNTSEFSACFGIPDLMFGDDFEGACSGRD